MLGPVEFLLPDGRSVSPFQVAPWWDDEGRFELPGILQQLRGEWPCVPFGTDAERTLPNDWPSVIPASQFSVHPHGFAANKHWQWGEIDDHAIEMFINYPEEHPIERLVRRITPDPKAPAVDFELIVQARQDCQLPFGLHPTFALNVESAQIKADQYQYVRSFPGSVEPGAEIFEPNRVFSSLDQLCTRTGNSIDATQLPLKDNCEDLLQVVGIDGAVALNFPQEKYVAKLNWQAEHFGSLLLWYSNYGRTAYPWNGEHQALGMEPVCSAFDLGPAVSNADNPINKTGVPTSMAFSAKTPLSTKYRVSVELSYGS